ncbi:hypothetical protein [Pelagicoccus mobilis]|uniref:DUF2066 domain-containing protein n=1 Tax=Pelagicoccus mobilis TaxID=415221 RepID=A0A934RU98_9BACT|nr:hypothetical protein [Pelagicoccus mobilis]MBK1877735.1 hypothetical protein [Pelagicoccus mobilis]
MIKKQICTLLTGAVAIASALTAAPLVQTEIAKDAKWLAHIDMEGILESSFADLGVAKLKEEIAKNNQSAISIDVDLVLDEIKSVTAYGASFEEDAANKSVVILRTGDRLQAIFDGFLAAQELEGNEIPLKRVGDKPYQTYLLEGELYLAFPNKNYAIAGKSFEQIEHAYEVIQGKADNLSATEQKLVLNADSGFFLMVTAKGIDSFKNVPPQARMLQKTKGGQVSIGESEGSFKANVMLTTANEEVSLQLYRIVQGMLALASFTQVENQSMMEIVDSVDVRQGEDFVSLDFQYPVEKLMKLVEVLAKEAASHHAQDHQGEHSSYQGNWEGQADRGVILACVSDG